MTVVTTASGLLAMLQEEHPTLKLHALKNLNVLVENFWPEISTNISAIESLYEDETFHERQLAALVASKVFYYLGELNDSLTYALGAGALFDVSEDTEYVQTLVAKCVDEYILLSVKAAEANESEKTVLDPRLVAIVERMLDKCMQEGKFQQAVGIALECRRLDKLEEAISRSENAPAMLSYCLRLSQTFVDRREFRHEVLRLLVRSYQGLQQPDYLSICQCLMFLDEPAGVAAILDKLLKGDTNEALLADQVAFDLFENEYGRFLLNVRDLLPEPTSAAGTTSPSVTNAGLSQVGRNDNGEKESTSTVNDENAMDVEGGVEKKVPLAEPLFEVVSNPARLVPAEEKVIKFREDLDSFLPGSGGAAAATTNPNSSAMAVDDNEPPPPEPFEYVPHELKAECRASKLMRRFFMATRQAMSMRTLAWLLLAVTPMVNATEDLSAGYCVTDINELADGSGIVAHLKLISGSETYGPDLEDLKLTARYEEGGRVHVHITDAFRLRWEMPESLLPRERVEQVRIGQSTSAALPLPDGAYTFKNNNLASSHPLRISWTTEPFSFAITRKANGEVLFNTLPDLEEGGTHTFNPMVFKDQYLEISTRLPQNSHLYGLGESTRPDGMRLAQGRTYTLWATDIGSWNVDIPLYSTYPFLMEMRKGGQAHAVLLLNTNGMDVDYKNGDLLTFKVLGGVFDFYFFAGPSPLAVMDQYTQLVGRPAAMPYWTFGFHQSRYGYKNVDELETVMAKYEAINFPVESIWSDIDHMDAYKDFTLHPEHYPEERLQSFVQGLHDKHQKFVMIIDPGIKIDETYPTFTRGRDLDVYLRNGTGDGYYIAQVWPGFTHIPDFLHPNAVDWWTKELEEFYKLVPFDGLWLDMNEPANFCSGPNCYYDPAVPCDIIDVCCMTCNNDPDQLTRWDNPPYKINGYGSKLPLYKNTVAMTAQHHDGSRMYDTHNIYGMAEGLATYRALERMTNKRPFVLARSCFVGAGAHAAHWTGDNGATWSDLKYSIASLLNSGLFGVPMVGADICGFYFETNEELCQRWSQVGAFYPFARSHSDIHTGPQEVYLWKSVTETASDVFTFRYRLLPFFYTLMYEAHTTGAPLARPLFFEYPEDTETWDIDRQFVLGNSILVSPVLEPGVTSVRAYFPKGIWYNLFDPAKMIRAMDHGVWEELPAAQDVINVHVRQGSIIPMQEFAMTTAAARKTPFSLLVAFAPASDFAEFCAVPYSIVCQGSDHEYATGHIFLDDDDQVTMAITEGRASYVKLEAIRTDGHYVLRSTVTQPEYALEQELVITTVSVLGVQSRPFSVHVNGRLAAVQVKVNVNASRMEFSGLHLPLGENFELVWNTMPNGSSSHPN